MLSLSDTVVEPGPDILNFFDTNRMGHGVLLPIAGIAILVEIFPGALSQFNGHNIVLRAMGSEDRYRSIGRAGFSRRQFRTGQVSRQGNDAGQGIRMGEGGGIGHRTPLGESGQEDSLTGDAARLLALDQVTNLLPGVDDAGEVDRATVLVETEDVIPGRHDIAAIAGDRNGRRIRKNETDAYRGIEPEFRNDGHEVRSVGTEPMHPDDRPFRGILRLEFDRLEEVGQGLSRLSY